MTSTSPQPATTTAADPLASWNDGKAKQAILDFVGQVTNRSGPSFVPPEARVAVFDNDGTLWCEKPLPIQADFLLRRVGEMAQQDPSLRTRQPWKAVVERDFGWLSGAITKHYRGDDSDLKEMAAGLLQAYGGITVEAFETAATAFLRSAQHPTLGRPYLACSFKPMVELLRYLETAGFANYIASGGGRDFMRPITQELYGVPYDRVIGSSIALAYEEEGDIGNIVRKPELDVFDDGPAKPVRIWSRIGRRPILAAGNSNGDIQMLTFTKHQARPSLSLLVNHDDAAREFDYQAGAEESLKVAAQRGWTVVSVKNDWATVFEQPQS
ncbi:MAG TPA: HAD family hydrolase [Dehalococcoidia bacterium]|jgi:phosphoglycolate phosphatase-like HAD superfamily hydrolase